MGWACSDEILSAHIELCLSNQTRESCKLIGSARDGAELKLLKVVAPQRLAAGQGELTWAWIALRLGGPVPITVNSLAAHRSCAAGKVKR
jgi:hypothetical protein